MKKHSWRIINEVTGEVCTYNSQYGIAVTEKHVRNSPKVKEWAKGNPIKVS